MSDIERWINEAVARGEMSDPFLHPSGQELAERGIGREDWEEDQPYAGNEGRKPAPERIA